MELRPSPGMPTKRTLWFAVGLSLSYSLTLMLPDILARAVQVLCGSAILFHLREMMAGRPVRWAWALEAAFIALCVLSAWALILAIRFVYA